jgi:transcriptional regulator with XRE-family HTH domain
LHQYYNSQVSNRHVICGSLKPARVTDSPHKYWGRWVLDRSRVAGFKTQLELAAAVGVTRQHLAKWIARKSPPERMRRKLDDALARALRTDLRTLFEDWGLQSPGDTPLVKTGPERDVPWEAEDPEDGIKRRDIRLMCDMLSGDDLEAVFRITAERWEKNATAIDQRIRESVRRLNIAKATGEWPINRTESKGRR